MVEATAPTVPQNAPRNMGFTQWYLLSYNQVSFFIFCWVLFLTTSHFLDGGSYKDVFDLVWLPLSYIQTFALLEVVHALFGWVKTPLPIAILQAASRLFLVWGVNYNFPQIHTHWSFTTMILSWCTAECIRYAFYMFRLSAGVPGFFAWIRYNMFYVLYPVGLVSELVMIFQALPYAYAENHLYFYGLIAAASLYIPGFLVMFSHMVLQRRKYMRGEVKKN